MAHPSVTASFENIGKADKIGVHVGPGILDAVPHTGLGRQIDDVAEVILLKKLEDTFFIGQIDLGETEMIIVRQNGQSVIFELYRIVGVQVVEPDNGMSHF